MIRDFPDESSLVTWGLQAGALLTATDCIFLVGPLGAGKTTLVRALVAGYGGDPEEVASPTYALHHVYETDDGRVIHHLDGYRVQVAREFEQMGLDHLPEGLLLVEWPEQFTLKVPTAILTFEIVGSGRRLHLEALPGHCLCEQFSENRSDA